MITIYFQGKITILQPMNKRPRIVRNLGWDRLWQGTGIASLLIGLISTVSADVILPVVRVDYEADEVSLSWKSEEASIYQIEQMHDVDQWTSVGDPVTGDGAIVTVPLNLVLPEAFFRLRVNDPLSSSPEGFVLIPAGPFEMGDAFGEGPEDELPLHTVNVSAFYMGKTEVTKEQWDETYEWAVANGYEFDNRGDGKAASHPVHTVSWYDVVKWCNAQSEREGLTARYRVSEGSLYKTGQNEEVSCDWGTDGYRLPTEAEWEKAARGGLAGKRFPWGDTISHNEANLQNLGGESYTTGTEGYHPTYNDGTRPYSSPVGSFAPNGYGLYDMAGNMWEWCWDWFGGSYYRSSSAGDPRGAGSGAGRVIRGGKWDGLADYCRVANRGVAGLGDHPVGRHIGFRTARSSVPQ